MQTLIVLSLIIAILGLFGICTRQTSTGMIISLQIVFISTVMLAVTFSRFVVSDSAAGNLFSITIALIAGLHLVLGGLLVLIASRLKRSPLVIKLSLEHLFVLVALVLVLSFKLEGSITPSIPLPLLTLIIGAGLAGLWWQARRTTTARVAPEKTDDEFSAPSQEAEVR